jgi:DNA polymerase-3 subunit epsilon
MPDAAACGRTRWVDGPLVGFDTETTGVDVHGDRIVTAAIVRREGRSESVTTWLIDPGVEIPEAASAIHGITTEHARAHGLRPADALDEIAATLAGALLRAEPLVAYNASFDLSLLEAELRRHGLATVQDRIGREIRVVLDPLVLDRHLDRYRRGKRKLVDLCGHYAVRSGDLHTADVDVAATLDVLTALCRTFPQLADADLDRVHDGQVRAHRRWAESFNTWRLGQGLTGPGAELVWPVRPTASAEPAALPQVAEPALV